MDQLLEYKERATEMFLQYRPMVEGFAWRSVKKYHLEIEDIRSQSYLIFCEAFKRFDDTKASFSTFLFHRLRTLNDYCSDQCKKNITYELPVEDDPIYEDIKFALFSEAMDKLETSLELSEDAQDIIDFILSRVWEVPGAKPYLLPRFNTTRKYYNIANGWPNNRTRKAWKEIETWWSGINLVKEA